MSAALRRFVGAFAASAALGASASAQVLVSPLRIVLSEPGEVAEVRISNQSEREAPVRLRFIDLAATPEGGYRMPDLIERDRYSAARWLRVEPADFTLPGKSARAVQVRLVEASVIGFDAWERRSHLLVESGAPDGGVRQASLARDLSLDMASGVSIPVIARPNAGAPPPPAVTIEDARFRRDLDNRVVLETVAALDAPVSAYGELSVYWQAAGSQTAERVGVLSNAAVNIDAPRRRFETPLDARDFADGVLTVRYFGSAEYAGTMLAEREFIVAPRSAAN